MAKLRQLKISAVRAANTRGHNLKMFRPSWPHGQGMASIAYCANCNAYVQVMETPAANEISIGGTAVAINCEPKKTN